ncbi:MAG: hypothetical protein EBW14_21325 [Oxalobacteraceae bacterium]|nr:hypothetical protein [Oxalobacteraceae bacterium]
MHKTRFPHYERSHAQHYPRAPQRTLLLHQRAQAF